MSVQIQLPQAEIEAFCRRHQIRQLSLFGSVLRDDFGPDSDIDVLVEFLPERVIGFLGLAQLEIELSQLLGRQVDIRTPAELSRYFREDVLNSAQVRYEQS